MSKRTEFPKYVNEAIYKNDDSEGFSQYAYLMPVEGAEGCYIGDCWECDAYGNINPEFSNSPVPHYASDIGTLVTAV
jgi:hypothetical protein